MGQQQVSAGFSRWFKRERTIVDEYDLLNSELVRTVEDESATANILEAVDWLKMATGERPLRPGLELPSKEALLRFTEMLNLMDPERPYCNLAAYNILNENELATGVDVLMPQEKLPAQRRVEMVIYEVAFQHARQCRYEYPHLFEVARRDKPKRLMRDIRNMLNAVIETSTRLVLVPKNRLLDPRHVLARKAKGVSMTGYNEAKALLLDLRHRARDDGELRFLKVMPDPRRRNHWIVNEGKVVEILERFVYSRCEFMFNAFEHILKPAEFDQQLYAEDHKYRAINEPSAELMIWLQYYRLCQAIMANKHSLENNVIKAIWSELKQ